MALTKVVYSDGETVIHSQNLNDIQDEVIANASTINEKQNISDSSLSTSAKTIVGAVNELYTGKEPADSTILKQTNVINNLTSTSITSPLSANQGKALYDTLKATSGILSCLNGGSAKAFRYYSCGCDISTNTTITIDATGQGYNGLIALIFTRYALTGLTCSCSNTGEYSGLGLTNILGTHPFTTATVTDGDIVLSLGSWQDFNMFYFAHSNQTPAFTVVHG